MKKILCMAIVALAFTQLNAINPAGTNFSADSKVVNSKTLHLQLVNLQQSATKIQITDLGGDVEFYTQTVKERNGFSTNLNLTELKTGKYLLTIKSNGTTQKQVIRVKDNFVLISDFAS